MIKPPMAPQTPPIMAVLFDDDGAVLNGLKGAFCWVLPGSIAPVKLALGQPLFLQAFILQHPMKAELMLGHLHH